MPQDLMINMALDGVKVDLDGTAIKVEGPADEPAAPPAAKKQKIKAGSKGERSGGAEGQWEGGWSVRVYGCACVCVCVRGIEGEQRGVGVAGMEVPDRGRSHAHSLAPTRVASSLLCRNCGEEGG